ncbi:MAG: PQQ-dependent sugar dehydrogenase, partial [Natronospirillum sp.]
MWFYANSRQYARMARWGLWVAVGFLPAFSQAEYRVETRVSGLEHPWSFAFLPDGDLLITERAGRLRYVTPEGQLQEAPISGLPNDIFVESQAGLMDIALAADFSHSHQVYLSYACGTANANSTCLASGEWRDGALHYTTEIFRARPDRSGA